MFLVDLQLIIKQNLACEQQVKHTNTVQVKHLNVISLVHVTQHDLKAAQDWQPAESTKSKLALPKKHEMNYCRGKVSNYYSALDILQEKLFLVKGLLFSLFSR